MKFCEECGAQMEDDALFCDNCGAQNAASPPEEAAENIKASETGETEIKTAESKKQPAAVVILGITVVVLLVVIVILVAGSRKKEETLNIPDTAATETFAVTENSAVTETTETAVPVETTETEEITEETEFGTEKTAETQKPKEETKPERKDNPAAYVPEELYENVGYVDSIDISGFYMAMGGKEYAELSMYSDEPVSSEVGTATFNIWNYNKRKPLLYENLTVYMTRGCIYYAVTDDGNVFYFGFNYADNYNYDYADYYYSGDVVMTLYFNDECLGEWTIDEHYYS